MNAKPITNLRVIQHVAGEFAQKELDVAFDVAGALTSGVSKRNVLVPVLVPIPPGYGALTVPVFRNRINPAAAGVQELGTQLRAAADSAGLQGPYHAIELFPDGRVLTGGLSGGGSFRLPGSTARTLPDGAGELLPEAPQGILDALRITQQLHRAA